MTGNRVPLPEDLHPGDRPEGFSPPARPPRRRGSLFVTEMQLREAWTSLAAADPECELSPEDAERFIARYIDPQAAIEARDDFADFVVEMEAFADAKDAEAQALKDEATLIRKGVERMKQSAIRTMDALNATELRGNHRSLVVKRSRGSVEVVDESKIPPQFWRVREDRDLAIIRELHGMIHRMRDQVDYVRDKSARLGNLSHASGLLREAEASRSAVDKNAIQAAWKEAGGDTVPVERALLDAWAVPNGPTTPAALRKAGITHVPVVPGVAKLVTTKLEIK